jgi:hypothetical protein
MNYAAMIAQLGLTEQQTRALMAMFADIERRLKAAGV